jgi:hypothetical protein
MGVVRARGEWKPSDASEDHRSDLAVTGVPFCAAPDTLVGFSGGLELRGSNDPAAS